MRRHKSSIGLLLVITVVGLFVSTCVPMPKSVLHSTHAFTAIVLHSTAISGVSLSASLWKPYVAVNTGSPSSGTELINLLCSRLC
jgi:hypothetical protein